MEKLIESSIYGNIYGKKSLSNFELMNKVNELIDVINELTKEVEKLKEKQK